jgi:hypothetical protein
MDTVFGFAEKTDAEEFKAEFAESGSPGRGGGQGLAGRPQQAKETDPLGRGSRSCSTQHPHQPRHWRFRAPSGFT